MVYPSGVGENRTPPKRRTTVSEAASILGISAEAVRGRIRRGTLPVERDGGTVYVLIARPAGERTNDDQPRKATEQPGRVEPQPSVEGAQEPAEASPRSWWRRMFGG